MSETLSHADQWAPCPAGELQSLVRGLASNRRRSNSYKMLGAIGGLATVLLVVTLVWRQEPGPPVAAPEKMTCDEVQPWLAEFAAETLSDPRLVAAIRHHLDQCPPCAAAYQRLLASRPASPTVVQHRQIDGPWCRHGQAPRLAVSREAHRRVNNQNQESTPKGLYKTVADDSGHLYNSFRVRNRFGLLPQGALRDPGLCCATPSA